MQEENYKNFGSRLRWIRTACGYGGESGAQRLATLLGVATSTLYSWEKKELSPSGEVVKKLAKVLHITEAKLLGFPERGAANEEAQTVQEDAADYGSVAPKMRRGRASRASCEAHMRAYLDAAEKVPDGIIVAHFNIIRRLPMKDFAPSEEEEAIDYYQKSKKPLGQIAAGLPQDTPGVMPRPPRSKPSTQ